MNLTIEQMREIVGGAPETATDVILDGSQVFYGSGLIALRGVEKFFKLHSIRTAIAEYESKMHSHLTSGVFQDDDHTDHVTDIRNHISPNTRVSEAHVNEAFKLNSLG